MKYYNILLLIPHMTDTVTLSSRASAIILKKTRAPHLLYLFINGYIYIIILIHIRLISIVRLLIEL